MDILKKPILRVPVVLVPLGILCRILTFVVTFICVQIDRAKGPNPETGVYEISIGYSSEIVGIISFVLFCAAGWKFMRSLTRRQIFCSATIMVVWHAILLILEQWILTNHVGSYMTLYQLWFTVEGTQWATQLLVRLFDAVSIPIILPSLLTPYLYLVFGRKPV